MFKRIALIGILALTSTSAVVADDYVAAGSHDWNGFYAGVFAGYGSGETINQYYAVVPDNNFHPVSIQGGLLGATAGVNAQYDSFVLGLEGDVAWSSVAGSKLMPSQGVYSTSNEIDWVATLRGRVGYAVDDFLLYATAGAAVAGVTNGVIPSPPATKTSTTTLGWVVGAGVEAAVTDNISVKAEYTYTDLGEVSRLIGAPLIISAWTSVHDTHVHAVKMGLNYAF